MQSSIEQMRSPELKSGRSKSEEFVVQRFKLLDLALRSRNQKDTVGELAAARFQHARQRVRQRLG